MEELEKAGVTGYVGKVNMDRNGVPGALQETTEESARETIRWLEGCRFDHVKPILTPRFTPSCTDALMEQLGQIAARQGLYVQSHLSESIPEMDWVRQLHPECERYWETYDKYGLWKDHTLMAHCVWSDETERAAMKRSGVVAVHCADSNVNICSGICPVRQMLHEWVWVTLGSDIAGGAQLPMYKVITATIRTSKNRRIVDNWRTDFLTVAEAYYLGTTSGHRYFGAGEGFAPGDKLHAIVLDDTGLLKLPNLNMRERLLRAVYRLDDRQIRAVYSEGVRRI
jgi:guanine deaminase